MCVLSGFRIKFYTATAVQCKNGNISVPYSATGTYRMVSTWRTFFLFSVHLILRQLGLRGSHFVHKACVCGILWGKVTKGTWTLLCTLTLYFVLRIAFLGGWQPVISKACAAPLQVLLPQWLSFWVLYLNWLVSLTGTPILYLPNVYA